MTLAHILSGALNLLTRTKKASVVATYIDPPPFPGLGSSEICRYPLIKPCLDTNKVMNAVPELHFSHICRTADSRRMLATLKFRLAMKFNKRQGGIVLKDFQAAASAENETTTLKACIQLFEINVTPQITFPMLP